MNEVAISRYWIYPSVHNEEEYGRYLVDELEEPELPEEAKKYFMYERRKEILNNSDGDKNLLTRRVSLSRFFLDGFLVAEWTLELLKRKSQTKEMSPSLGFVCIYQI